MQRRKLENKISQEELLKNYALFETLKQKKSSYSSPHISKIHSKIKGEIAYIISVPFI